MQVPSPVAATAQKASAAGSAGTEGSAAQHLYREGEKNMNLKSQRLLEGSARDAATEGLAFQKGSGLTSRKIFMHKSPGLH